MNKTIFNIAKVGEKYISGNCIIILTDICINVIYYKYFDAGVFENFEHDISSYLFMNHLETGRIKLMENKNE